MLEAIGLRRTKLKRLSLNTNVIQIQPPLPPPLPGHEITSSKVQSKGVARDNADRNSASSSSGNNICSRYQQKFPKNVKENYQCSLRGLGSSIPSSSSNDGNSRVCCIVEKFKNYDHQESDESSLNYNPSPLEPSYRSSLTPRKRAVLIGVTYKRSKYELKETVNYVKNMRNLLIDDFSFCPQNILVLTEAEPDPQLIPTKKNIETSLKWLVEDCWAGDSLVFYFSGHGLQQPDFNRDERDGFGEIICPVDFMEKGMILDNEINSTIVRPLPKGVTLHAIVDACHSGTILDLAYVYNRELKIWEDNSSPYGPRKHTNGGLAISISACHEDNQMAANTSVRDLYMHSRSSHSILYN